MALTEVIKLLKRMKEKIKKQYKAEIIGVFGSFARGEQKKESDIDILVKFDQDADLLVFAGLSDYLGEKIGKKIDLVSIKTVKETIHPYIMQELVAV